MARSIFLLFCVIIICLSVLVVAGVIENTNLRNQLEQKTILLDSVQAECEIKDFTLSRYDFIIEEFKSKYPEQTNAIINETE